MAGLSRPMMFTVFPHACTGTSTGAATEFPDRTPGESLVTDRASLAAARSCRGRYASAYSSSYERPYPEP
ncbi:hypothetical protein [Streptomyces sp. NPDC001205]